MERASRGNDVCFYLLILILIAWFEKYGANLSLSRFVKTRNHVVQDAQPQKARCGTDWLYKEKGLPKKRKWIVY